MKTPFALHPALALLPHFVTGISAQRQTGRIKMIDLEGRKHFTTEKLGQGGRNIRGTVAGKQ